MTNLKPLIDDEGEVRELTAEDMTHFLPVSELPPSLQQKLGVRGPQKKPKKERITIRLSPEVVTQFRATGQGWQTRLDLALQQWLQENSPVDIELIENTSKNRTNGIECRDRDRGECGY